MVSFSLVGGTLFVRRIMVSSFLGSIHKQTPGKPVCPNVDGDGKSLVGDPLDDLRTHPKALGSFSPAAWFLVINFTISGLKILLRPYSPILSNV